MSVKSEVDNNSLTFSGISSQELKPYSSSPSIDKLAVALAKAQGEFDTPIKDKVNPHFKSKYASLLSTINATKKGLSNNGLAISQLVSSFDSAAIVSTVLMHQSGQWISNSLLLKSANPSPQGMGSAITYGRRYGRAAILDIDADEDDDGNAASKHEAPKQEIKEEFYTGTPDQRSRLRDVFKAKKLTAPELHQKIHAELLAVDVKMSELNIAVDALLKEGIV